MRPALFRVLLGIVPCAAAAAQDIGYRGPPLAGSGPSLGAPSVCESKPQSKLWFHDGAWWGSLWSSSDHAFHIQRLNRATHEWIDTGVDVESRPDSHSDALFDGTKLYLLSHEFATAGGSPGEDILLLRYGYNGVSDTWSLDAGFPVVVGDAATEAAVIDKDSTGTLWVVWTSQQRVWVNHSLGSDLAWGTPSILPGNTSALHIDDICTLVRFGNRIGVMWSDQVANRYAFSYRVDGAPESTWSAVEAALAGESDDHIHLEADSTGRVFASVKNAANDLKLLVRDAAGDWSQHLVSSGAEVHLSRPIVLLNEEERRIDVFATMRPGGPVAGDTHHKTSPLDSIAFPFGPGTKVLHDADGLITDPTSTKQNWTSSTGLVVLAANDDEQGTYWHHEIAPAPPTGALQLAQPSPGVAGTQTTFVASGVGAGRGVAFYFSQLDGAAVHPRCPGVASLDLGAPIGLLGNAVADSQGVATLSVFAPQSIAGRTYLFQALAPSTCGKSNVVTEQF